MSALHAALTHAVAVALALGGCGRIGFDDTGAGDGLVITPAVARSNLNTTTAFAATGGMPPYTFTLTGPGSLDAATGRFRAPSFPGTAMVTASDAAGDAATAEISFGGDHVYVVGGFVNDLPRDEVWRTVDGVQWEVVGTLPMPLGSASVLVFDDQLIVLGGAVAPDGASFDTVWRSTDGVTWTEHGQLPRGFHAQGAAVFRDRLWLAGGIDAQLLFADVVWSSADGTSWRIEPPLPIGIHGAMLMPFDDTLWLVAGHDTAGQAAPIYARGDDGSWRPIGGVPIAGEYHGVTVRGDRLWVAGGVGLGDRVVTTTDGTAWVDVSRLPIPRLYLSLLEHQDELWVVGGIPSPTLRSADGTSWSSYAPFPVELDGGVAVSFTPR